MKKEKKETRGCGPVGGLEGDDGGLAVRVRVASERATATVRGD